jgi:hypothetical protein
VQQARHRADYDFEEPLDPSHAVLLAERAIGAFHAWNGIRDADIALEYLQSLLFRDRTF